ncbi:MAG: hypothetical protein AVDCRST_MAG15-3417, partial [uncultured Rubellimicrobium sp.]
DPSQCLPCPVPQPDPHRGLRGRLRSPAFHPGHADLDSRRAQRQGRAGPRIRLVLQRRHGCVDRNPGRNGAHREPAPLGPWKLDLLPRRRRHVVLLHLAL